MCMSSFCRYACKHSEKSTYFCVRATTNRQTGVKTACENERYLSDSEEDAKCPHIWCNWIRRGIWKCCRCGYNKNLSANCEGLVPIPGQLMSQTCLHPRCKECDFVGGEMIFNSIEVVFFYRHSDRSTGIVGPASGGGSGGGDDGGDSQDKKRRKESPGETSASKKLQGSGVQKVEGR